MLSYEEKAWEQGKDLLFVALTLILFSNLSFDFLSVKALFLLPWILSIYLFSIDLKTCLIAVSCSGLLIALQNIKFLQVKGTYLNYFSGLNSRICSYLNNVYRKDLASFIKLLVFNSGKNLDLFKEFKNLGIVHLISISGFHFLLLFKVLSRLVCNREVLKKFIVFPLLVVYWASINYSIPALRAFLYLLIPVSNPYKKWAVVVFVSLLFNVSIYKSLSFLLSYFLSLLFLLTRNIVKDKLNLYILNLWTAYIYSTLVLLYINKSIYPLALLNLIIFEPIVIFLFFYFFFTWPFSFLAFIHKRIYYLFNTFQSSLTLNKTYIYLSDWNIQHTLLSLCIFSFLTILICKNRFREI